MHITIILFVEADNKKEAKEKAIYSHYFSGHFRDFAFTNFISWTNYKDISNPSIIRYNTKKGKELLNKSLKNEESEIRNEDFVELNKDDIKNQFKDINKIWMVLVYCHL